MSNPSVLRRIGRVVDTSLMSMFSFIAYRVAMRPYLTIVCCIIVGLIVGAGIARIKVITSPEDLYTPQGTEGFRDREYVNSLYGYGQVYVYIYSTANNQNKSSVLNTASLLAQLDLWDSVTSVVGTYNGTSYLLENPRVCYRPGGSSTPCDVVSILDFWNYSRSAIAADADILTTVSNASAVDRLGRKISPDQVMGGITRDSSGKILGALAFQMTLTLQNVKSTGASDVTDKVTDAWQEAAVSAVRKLSSDSADFFINSEWAQNDVSDKAITSDISLLIFGYGLLLIYGLLVLSKRHPVYSQSHMTLANIGSIGLAVLATYGLCILAGVGFSLVVQVLALVLLGLGTDDMLVTMAAHEETGKEMPNASIVDRIVATVSRARRGVIVAALTNFVAFCSGTASSLPALTDFCIFAAVGVVLVLVFQSTFFVACLTLDVRRQQRNKMDCLSCCTSSAGPTDGCCGAPYDPDALTISQRIIGKWLANVVLHPVGKLVVLSITIFLFVAGVIGALQAKQEFNFDWFIPNSSWVSKVLAVRNEYFAMYGGRTAIPFAVYTKNFDPPIDYFDHLGELQAVSDALVASKYVSKAPAVQSWYTSYAQWLNTSAYAANLTASSLPSTSAVFYASLKDFLASDGVRFSKNVIFSNTSSSVIVSSRIRANFISLASSVEQVNAMNAVRSIASTSARSLAGIAYTPPFLFFEGFAVIKGDTIKEVAIAGGSIFVILLLLLADLTSAVSVGVMVAFIDVELVGFLHWADLSLNSVTAINLLLAVGIAVDYSAFTAFSFMTRTGTRQERAQKALANFGVAVFNGGLTLFLAVLPAVFAQSFIFQTFFKMFAMIVVLGLWHGLCVLPVVLSLIGAPAFDSAYEREALLSEKVAAEEAEAARVELVASEAPAPHRMD